MLRNFKIRPRLLIGFGVLMPMTAALVTLSGFGLYAARQGLMGTTQQLIPASKITVAGRSHLLASKAAGNTMVALITNEAGIRAARSA
jgi:hypothetical protein